MSTTSRWRTLAEVVDVLTRAGQWDNTNLIVSSDHWQAEKRAPPGQRKRA